MNGKFKQGGVVGLVLLLETCLSDQFIFPRQTLGTPRTRLLGPRQSRHAGGAWIVQVVNMVVRACWDKKLRFMFSHKPFPLARNTVYRGLQLASLDFVLAPAHSRE